MLPDHLRQDQELELVHDLAQRFQRMVRVRQPEELSGWVQASRASQVSELGNFAEYVERDVKAVRAGLSEPWSNGQTEGQITKLKLLKRQMYGRASFELLRRRVLNAG